MENKKTKHYTPTILAFTLACTWFATHVGGGFATGVQLWQFYGAFGVFGLVTIVGWGLISTWINYNSMEFARLTGKRNYIAFLEELYKPLPRFGAITMEVMYHPMMVVAISIVLATAGALGRELFGAPYIVGILVMIFIISAIVMYGAGIVRAASTAMSIGIVVPIVLISVVAIAKHPVAPAALAVQQPMKDIPMALVMMVMYVGVQVTNSVALISVSEPIKDQKTSKLAGLFGFLLNVTMMLLAVYTLLSYAALLGNAELPMLAVAKGLGPLYYVLYFVMLVMAAVTTGVGIMTGIVAIIGSRLTIIKKNEKLNSLVICLIYIVLAAILANGFGLDTIISKFLPVIGGISVLAVILPIAVVAPIKNARMRRAQSESAPAAAYVQTQEREEA